MPRPWLFHFRPFVMPSDDRAELSMIANGLTDEEYLNKIWELRYPGADSARYWQSAKPSKIDWPVVYVKAKTRKSDENWGACAEKPVEIKKAVKSVPLQLVKP